jgi:hypothetical protein
MQTKALWSKQADDELVASEWASMLARIEYEDAVEALTEIHKLGGDSPPTVGQLRLAALRVADRREADERYKRRALEDHSPRTDSELTSIRQMVDEFFARQGTTREAVEKKLGEKK